MLLNVKTKYGEVQGVVSEGGYALFKGIPYAAPPVGELRWKKPEPPIPWEGVRICDEFGPACLQEAAHLKPGSFYGKEFFSGSDYPPKMSEDCLFLNIWTPARSADDKLPVKMWIHGGGVQNGYSFEKEFDGDEIARRGVILVTIGYRVNIFGFFAHPELTSESGHNASGNYGILDQIQALKWLRENIAAFGGDPDNITIFGQSGGGRSVQAICCSPRSKGLMKHAIVQSAGGISTAAGRLPREKVELQGIKFMEYIGCKNISQMRAIPGEELLNKFLDYMKEHSLGMSTFNISTDGYVLPLSLEDSIIQGVHAYIDYMLGNTADEGRILGMLHPERMMASLRGWARLQLKQGKKPAYMYCFERKLPGDDAGAFHSAELWYIFGTLNRSWRPFTEADYKLSEQMIDYWTNFAKTGNPNGKGLVEWTPFTDDFPCTMKFSIEGNKMTDYSNNEKLKEFEDQLLNSQQ